MECPVCHLVNPPDTAACDCGHNFTTGVGGVPVPFYKRYRTVLVMATVVVGVPLMILLLLTAAFYFFGGTL